MASLLRRPLTAALTVSALVLFSHPVRAQDVTRQGEPSADTLQQISSALSQAGTLLRALQALQTLQGALDGQVTPTQALSSLQALVQALQTLQALQRGSRSGNGGGNDNNGGPSTSSTSLTLSTLFQVLQQLQATGIITNGVPQSSSGGVNGVPQLGTTGTQGNTVTQGNPVGNSPFSTQGPQRGGSIQSLRPLPAQSSAESVSSQRLPAQAGTTGTVPVVVPQRPPERGSLRDLDSLEAATDTAVQTLRGMSAAVRSIRP